jgi:hypothetical protein
MRLAVYFSISTSLPDRVVSSAAVLISAKCSSSQSANARASRALANRNAGARCMWSAMMVVVTPPDSCSSRMPRL